MIPLLFSYLYWDVIAFRHHDIVCSLKGFIFTTIRLQWTLKNNLSTVYISLVPTSVALVEIHLV